MRQLSQRVGLVHELGQLGATKELPNSSNHRADVDQSLRCGSFGVHQCHLFFDHTLHAEQAHAYLVLDEFANTSYAAVTQMVNVVRMSFALVDANHGANHRDHVF